MSASRFDLIVFDWDGTLADSTTVIAEALQGACRDVGCRVPDEVAARYVIGLGLTDALRHVAPDLALADHPRLSARFRDHYLAREAQIPLFDGARELLQALRANGHRLAVATGKTRVGLDRALAFHGVAEAFDATRCADEGRPKPYPDMLLHLMQRLGVRPDRTLMIGDTTHDLQMAADAGVAAVGVTHGAHVEALLRTANPVEVLASLDALRAWLTASDAWIALDGQQNNANA
jgi:phosphoglycolate phosphatase